MKINLIKSALLFTTVTLISLASCKKTESTTPDASSDIQLLKITSWNPSTGAEANSTEFTYDNSGKIKTVTTARVTLTANYSNNKITSLVGTNSTGGVVSYSLSYNVAGQLSKVVYIFMNPTDYGYTKTFEYNAAGKVSKTSSLGTAAGSTPYVVDYVWGGDNITSASTTSSSSNFVTTYTYDDKFNPYSLGEGVAAIIAGSPQSKNNFTELKVTYPTVTSTQKRTYTYNTAGYATSLALADGSNEGIKFYYNK